MMIPSEMPSVTMGENGHGNGHFKSEPSNVFQHAEQLMRSQLMGQMPQMGSDQMQMLQNLHQMKQEAGRKQKEQQEQSKILVDSAEGAKRELPQLMQELQLNILQQSHLLQAGETPKSSQQLHQLQSKQQQLVGQLQFAQHAITLAMLAHKQEEEQSENRLRHRSDAYSSDGSMKENQSDNTQSSPPARVNGNGTRSSSDDLTPVKSDRDEAENLLYGGGLCRWPGCERECSSPEHWRNHMSREHFLNDKTTAQARVQMQIVTQLEVQLRKEKVRLAAMMKHLHPNVSPTQESLDSPEPKRYRTDSPPPNHNMLPKMTVPELLKNSPHPQIPQYSNPLAHLMLLTPSSPSMSPLAALSSSSLSMQNMQHTPTSGNVRSTLHDNSYSMPVKLESHRRRVTHHDRGNPNLDPEEDLAKNREFYRVQDVRPPYTYAALIRAAILEAPYQQLTLHDIYSWFTTTFCYFRRNAASWKNAVRHNLSLHKCFKRVENVKGAVWTVDDQEYHKKRNPKGNNQWTSALESPKIVGSPSLVSSPSMLSSPSLYEGAFRLDTAGGNPFNLTAHMTFNPKQENIQDQEDSPLSSPVLDDSYKIRIGPSLTSLSPHSPEDDDYSKPELDSDAAQDLRIADRMEEDCPEDLTDRREVEETERRIEEPTRREFEDLPERRSVEDTPVE